MTRKYCVECIDDGVIITKYGREHGFENPTGSTVLFNCDRLDDAVRLAFIALGGFRAVRKAPMDWEIDVEKIDYTVRYQEDEDDE